MAASKNKLLLEYLKKIKLFTSLSDANILHFINELEPLTLENGTLLFNQGDYSDSIYVLTEGRLVATLNLPNGDIRIVGLIDPGEIVGELGAISDQPRSLSVRAIEESHLLKLSKTKFQQLAKKYPKLLYEIVYFLTARSHRLIELLSEKTYRHISILPANDNFGMQDFVELIKNNFNKYERCSTLIIENDFQETPESLQKLHTIIAESERAHKGLVFILFNTQSSIANICLRKSNSILIVNEDQNPDKSFDKKIFKLLNEDNRSQLNHKEFLLIHSQKKTNYPETRFWFNNYDFNINYHMATDSPTDIAKALRLITGTALGLVLGGGGAKTWAEIGALKAIEEMAIQIDSYGGTSAGGIISAAKIIFEDFDVILEKILYITNAVRRPFALKNLTLPLISILNGKNITYSLQEVFGDIYIEDLSEPFFTVSSNLSTGQVSVHRFGPLWFKLRATCAIPGIVPPVTINDQIHVDGGVLNNLPVDVMRDGMMYSGKIIAVSVSNRGVAGESYNTKYNIPLILPLMNSLGISLGISGKEYKIPPFFDTFLNSLLLGSSKQEYLNSMEADILIAPSLQGYTMLSIKQIQIDNVMQLGYDETIKQTSHLVNAKNLTAYHYNFRRESVIAKFLKHLHSR